VLARHCVESGLVWRELESSAIGIGGGCDGGGGTGNRQALAWPSVGVCHGLDELVMN
jgi:hypothetical protein